jgi:hypothetical protein
VVHHLLTGVLESTIDHVDIGDIVHLIAEWDRVSTLLGFDI